MIIISVYLFVCLLQVTMGDKESAERAVKEANPIIDGRKANVNLAYLGAKPRNNTQNGKLNITLFYITPRVIFHIVESITSLVNIN